jgi:DNA-binding IclR family transcriptional regulator
VSKVDLVLKLLGDRKWHDVEEVQRALGLEAQEVQEIVAFFRKYKLAEVDDEKRKVRINRDFQKLSGLEAV